LQDALMGTLNDAELKSLENEWIEILEQTLKNLPIELMTRVHKEFNMEKVKQLYTLTKHLNLIIVNSDPNRSNSHLELPDDDGGWNSTKMWVLIGGDILGRGLTIPQLTVTYFLRHPNKPNFDTVSQQMRFCGYRYRYSKFVFIHCQDHTFTMFEYMYEIDSTIWRRAEIWDSERLDILSTLPAVLYASRGGIRLEPVRKSVTDPDLIDQKITENIFSLRSIFDPNDFRLNLSTLKSFIFEEKLNQTEIDHELWKEYIEPTSLQFQRIISTWSTPDPREYSILIGAAELFNEEMGELGLANVPKRIFVRKNLFNPVDSFTEFKSFIDSIDITRRVSLKHNVHNLDNWSKLFMHGMTINQKVAKWPTLAVPHVGEGQRKMRDDLNENASILIIEPTLGLEKTRERSSTIAVGCAFTLMSPLEFDLRLIGHRV